jgi:diadenosine tetraphosphate (Ap4A) HIT family hydrolase
MTNQACELCDQDGGEVIFRNNSLRILLVDDVLHPGFCRVIWNEHIKEMTDLAPSDRSRLMMTVCLVESVIREIMQPVKINLASLGNMVPHLHWHIIPRYTDDAQFPAPVWVEAKRVTSPEVILARQSLLPALRKAMVQRLNLST